MRLAHTQENGIHVVIPSGSVTFAKASTLRETLVELIEQNPGKEILVNLGGVREMDQFTLRALFAAQAAAKKNGVTFALIEARGRWQKVLSLTKMDAHFTQYPTMGSAISALRPKSAVPTAAMVA